MYTELDSSQKAPQREQAVLDFWKQEDVFARTIAEREASGAKEWVFYEGPPTANGRPGVHHVQARAYKDLFPRFKTMQGHLVRRKAGWDCHGLPVEIEVEKKLGFTDKSDIEKYGVEEFNKMCRESVMEYEGVWRELTERIGFWVNLDEAYMTMTNNFVESVWWSLKELWNKDLLYKGYKVIPYCAKDGTPLSSHEVSQGYKDVVDASIYVRFPLKDASKLGLADNTGLLVWTTTPWTLPGNVASAVHADLTYVVVEDENGPLLLCESLVEKVFGEGTQAMAGKSFKGSELVGLEYHAPYTDFEFDKPGHRIITGDFVTADDGTGIVHIAPAFGADDMIVGKENNLPVVRPVDPAGRFIEEVTMLKGTWFKDADPIVIKDLEERKLLFKKLDYEHSYPHCWRCKNPLMYYATDSWFIKNTSVQDRLIKKNQTLDWHPAHIKDGRYGNWLDNLVDWALSRNRYWGTPLPIWECSTCGERDCVGSYAELAEKSTTPLDPSHPDFDPHRPHVDKIKFKCPQCNGEMSRISAVIDCWYDSGAMPFAQLHYPFENKEYFEEAAFPADFICEGLDQTRGWFNSLHQLGVMLFDKVAYKSVICHGLVLDGEGAKMSKTHGNAVDPWSILDSEGADALRWYLYVSAPPEHSRRFSRELVNETARRFLGTLLNTYNFFVLNANAAKLDLSQAEEPAKRDALDRWLVAHTNKLVRDVTADLEVFDLTPAARKIDCYLDDLSNWYVRRARRKFWSEEVNAFATLWGALETLSRLIAPFVPFMAETIYRGLHNGSAEAGSVHLSSWPVADESLIDEDLLESTAVLQKVVSLGRAARAGSGQRTRQPLPEVLVRVPNAKQQAALEKLGDQLMEELNVKSLRFLGSNESFLDYGLKPNLKLVGRKYGKLVPAMKKALVTADGKAAAGAVAEGKNFDLEVEGQTLSLEPDELLVEARSPEGYAAQEDGGYLVALSTDLTPELEREGLARDLVRHIQELRKECDLDITDRIKLHINSESELVKDAVEFFRETIASETLADKVAFGESAPAGGRVKTVELKAQELSFELALLKTEVDS